MRARSSVVLAAALALVGCERPSSRIICHNANCAEPVDPDSDDTVAALEESLALRIDGRPIIDGVEFDLFWHDGRCLFAHDIGYLDSSDPIEVPTAVLAAYLRDNAVVAYSGEMFDFKIEIKPQVGKDAAILDQADCAIRVAETVRDAAADGGHPITVIFDSFDPALLRAVQSRPDRPISTDTVTILYSADFGKPPPLGSDTRKLSAFSEAHLDVVEIHPSWITDAAWEAYRSMGLQITLWMFNATSETLDGIERYEPDRVVTSEATLVRRWLD